MTIRTHELNLATYVNRKAANTYSPDGNYMSDRHVLSKNQDYQAHLLTTLPTENSEIKMATPAKPTLPALKPDSDTESDPSYDKLKPDINTKREPSYDKHGFLLVARDVANIAPGLRVSRAVQAVMDSKEREKCRGFVTLALEPKFQHFMPSNGIECLEEAHSITMRVIALTEQLTGYGCQDVFFIRTDLDTSGSIIGDG